MDLTILFCKSVTSCKMAIESKDLNQVMPGGGGGGTSTSFVRRCVATLSEN